MKTIEEINKIAPYHPNEWQQGYGIWQAGYMQGAEDQKKIDVELFEKWYCKKKCYKRKECLTPKNVCYRLGQVVKEIENI